MFALIFGMISAVVILNRVDVGDRDADGERGQHHQSDHQDYGHVAVFALPSGSRIVVDSTGDRSFTTARCPMLHDNSFQSIRESIRCA